MPRYPILAKMMNQQRWPIPKTSSGEILHIKEKWISKELTMSEWDHSGEDWTGEWREVGQAEVGEVLYLPGKRAERGENESVDQSKVLNLHFPQLILLLILQPQKSVAVI